MFTVKYCFIWQNGFRLRVEDFLKLTNQKQELPMTAMFGNRSEQNEQYLKDLHIKFQFIWSSSFRGEDF